MAIDGDFYRLLHVEESGPPNATLVVLLHGWGSSAQLMRPIAEALSAEYRVLNVDLPGHGHSPDPPRALGVPEHAALVAALIRSRTSAPVVLIGHSNGGRIGLYLASDDASARILRKIILISPSGIRPRRTWKYYLRRSLARLLKAPFLLLPGKMRAFGLDWLRHSLVWKLLGSSDYRTLTGVMRETFVRTVNHYVEDRLGRILAPTLIFWGDQDTAISRDQIAVLEEGIPDVGVVEIKGAGHYGHLDDPDTVIQGALYFLSEDAELRPASVEDASR